MNSLNSVQVLRFDKGEEAFKQVRSRVDSAEAEFIKGLREIGPILKKQRRKPRRNIPLQTV